MLRTALLLSLVTTSLAALGAAEPSPFAAPTSDVMLTLKVTAALQADALKDLPLTVDVARGVATVGGEVPDAARLADVRAAASAVAGVTGVSVTCRVAGDGDQFLGRVREKLASPPTAKAETTPQAPPRRVETRVTAHRPAESGQGAAAVAEALRAGDARFAGLSLAFEGGVVVVSGRAASHEDVTALLLHLRKVPGVERVRRGSIAAAG